DPDRPADGVADVALVEARFIDLVGRRAVSVIDPGVGVHSVVAAEAVKRAMKILRPTSRHGADLSARRAPVLGLVVRGQHLEFVDGVGVALAHLAVIAGARGRHSVDLKFVGAGAPPLGAYIGDVPRRTVVGRGDEAGGDGGQRREIAPVDGDVAYDLALHGVGALGALGLDERGFGGDRDSLAGGAHLHDDVA